MHGKRQLRPGTRYALNLTGTLSSATAAALAAHLWWPHPIAVITAVGALTAIICAPFITPIDREDT